MLLNHLSKSESKFGIIIENAEEFVNMFKNLPEFVPESDFDQDEYINLWESKLDGHDIMGVCCRDKWVIMPNYHRLNGNSYIYKKENFRELEDLCNRLNENGYKCKIGIVSKQCGCS